LHWPPPVVQAVQEVSLRLGRQQAELRATVELTAPNKDLALVEWDVQVPGGAWTVAGVFGPEVRRWSQDGARLLIWLERSSGAVRLELAGWLALTPEGGHGRLELPWLHVNAAHSEKTTLRLSAEPGLRVVPGLLRNLKDVSTAFPAGERGKGERTEWVYQAQESQYGGSVVVQAGPAGGAASVPVQVLTLVEVVDRQLTFSAVVVQRLRQGEGRSVQIRLRDWAGPSVEVKVAGLPATAIRERRLAANDRVWTVDLPPGAARLFPIALRGQMPLAGARLGVWMPDVSVLGVPRQDHWLALGGKELIGSAGPGLVEIADLARASETWRQSGAAEAWPGEVERLRKSGGTVWQATGPDWRLPLLPRLDQVVEAQPLRVFLSEHSAAVVDGRHWVHEVGYWIQQQAGTDLNVALPAPATLLAVSLDGVEVTPLQPEPRRVWLPLAGPGGVRQVRLRFRYEGAAEQLDRPLLAQPRLEGAVTGPAIWDLHVPPGFSLKEAVTSTVGLKEGRARAATLALYRAAAQARICAALAEPSLGGNTEEQRGAAAARLALDCRLAEQDLELAGNNMETGPDGQTLMEWLGQLKVQAQRESRVEDRGSRIEKQSSILDPRSSTLDLTGLAGVPYHGYSGSGKESPQVQLVSVQSQRTRVALLASGEWLGLLAVGWVVTLLPFLPAWARLLWPEQLLVLAGLSWYLGGLWWTPLVLAALWVLSRAIKAALWLRHP